MKATVAMGIALFIVAGCAQVQHDRIARFADACTQIGYKPGTMEHARCTETRLAQADRAFDQKTVRVEVVNR